MSYNFKKLSEVELATESKETDTVLIVQDGQVKRTDKVKGGGGSAMILTPEDFVEFDFNPGEGGSSAVLTREKFNEFTEAFPLVALEIPASYAGGDFDGVLKLGLSSGAIMQIPGQEEGFMMDDSVFGSFNIFIAEE